MHSTALHYCIIKLHYTTILHCTALHFTTALYTLTALHCTVLFVTATQNTTDQKTLLECSVSSIPPMDTSLLPRKGEQASLTPQTSHNHTSSSGHSLNIPHSAYRPLTNIVSLILDVFHKLSSFWADTNFLYHTVTYITHYI